MSYVASTYGSSLINQVSVAAGKNAAAIVDLTTKTAGFLLCKILCGSSPPTVATTFSLYHLPSQAGIASPITTVTSSVSAAATSFSVGSATGISTKCTLIMVNPATGLGELVTVTGVSGTTLTVNALINNYTSATGGVYANIFVMEQSTTYPLQPGTSWAASTEYSATMYVPGFALSAGALFAVVALNGDATYAVTVTCNLDYLS